MSVETAYKYWSEQYDTNDNKTRDLEGVSLVEALSTIKFENCLEIGCGTGKNTIWLESKVNYITAVDLSKEMMEVAKSKLKSSSKVNFIIADINESWDFIEDNKYDLATFSLVLEHIENIENIFLKLSEVIQPNGYVYIGELHPFKQYNGSKARFNTESGEYVVNCFTHHISDFTNAAKQHGFEVVLIKEYFDDNNRNNIPRILTILLKKVS